MRSRLLGALLAVLLLCAAARAQAPSEEDARYRIRTTVDLVVVPVTVKDSDGRLVQGLDRSQFRVLEEGKEQKLALFSVDPFPLSAVILVDTGLGKNALDQVKQTLPAIIGAFSQFDEFEVYTFDTIPLRALDWTSDVDALNKTIHQLQKTVESVPRAAAGGPMTAGPRINGQPIGPGIGTTQRRSAQPSKAIDDAVFTAALDLRRRERGRRKIILLVSDGLNSRNNLNSYDDTIKVLLANDISVYSIGVADAAWLNRLSNVLAKYAHATGGDIYYAIQDHSLESLYAQIAVQARNQYTLGYVPQKGGALGEYRHIEVRVRGTGLTVLARDGYYTSPRAP